MKVSENSLKNHKIWQDAISLSVILYGEIDKLPKEEEWDMARRLHEQAFAVSNEIAQALGGIDPRDKKWQLGKARSALFGIKSNLTLAHKTNELGDNAETIVLAESLVAQIDEILKTIDAEVQNWYKSLNQKPEEKA